MTSRTCRTSSWPTRSALPLTSVIFSAVYGVRLVQLDHPTMNEFYNVWEDMLNYRWLSDFPSLVPFFYLTSFSLFLFFYHD